VKIKQKDVSYDFINILYQIIVESDFICHSRMARFFMQVCFLKEFTIKHIERKRKNEICFNDELIMYKYL